MVVKPVIIVADGANQQTLNQILFGIEEEQVAVKVEVILGADLIERAYQAALISQLGVGIAFDEQKAVLHFKGLPEQEPLFIIDASAAQTALTALGVNAARLVKGIPFKQMGK